MLWITCPHCGHRPIDEFRFGGEIPDVPESIADQADRDIDRVWMFNNVDGVTVERWFHEGGCRRWMTLKRDTHLDRVIED
jgi:heterotetrameric sarcosine oxidase delta subunit